MQHVFPTGKIFRQKNSKSGGEAGNRTQANRLSVVRVYKARRASNYTTSPGRAPGYRTPFCELKARCFTLKLAPLGALGRIRTHNSRLRTPLDLHCHKGLGSILTLAKVSIARLWSSGFTFNKPWSASFIFRLSLAMSLRLIMVISLFLIWCARQASNLHPVGREFESRASANSATRALIWWARSDSNRHGSSHRGLSSTRLPITPLARYLVAMERVELSPFGYQPNAPPMSYIA